MRYLLIFCCCTPLFAATYYVATSGSDTNLGTQDEPWLTIQKGFNVAQPGDTVTLLSGTYASGAISRLDGTAVAPITVVGQDAIVAGELEVTNSYHVLRNLRFEGFRLILSGPAAQHNILESNVIVGAQGGIRMADATDIPHTNGPAYNIARWNVVSNWQYNAAVNLNGHDNIIQSNRFEHSGGWDAIRCFGYGHIIQANVFNDVSSNPTNDNHCDIIQTFGDNGAYAFNMIFERNIITNGTGQLCNITADGVTDIRDWTFRNNLVANARAQANIAVRNIAFYNNTFYRSLYPVLLSFGGPSAAGDGEGGRIFNNIFVECGDTIQNGFYGINQALTNCVADYNFIAGINGTTKTSASGLLPEANGINGGDIKFVDPANQNFHLQAHSPARSAGTNLSAYFTTDKNGVSRGATWDIGAFQYVSTVINVGTVNVGTITLAQ